MKYYIATKLENHVAHNELRDELQKRGHQITYDWTVHNSVWMHGMKRIKEVIELEVQGVLDADIVIVLWPGGRGTHVELGIAIGKKKRIIFVSNIEDHHNATKEVCGFYHYRTCICVRTIEETLGLVSFLTELKG